MIRRKLVEIRVDVLLDIYLDYSSLKTVAWGKGFYSLISTVLTPNRFLTLSLYLTSTTFDELMFSFSPAHRSCKQVARSKKSPIFNSRSNSLLLSLDVGLVPGQI